jgi:hypothetical protein
LARVFLGNFEFEYELASPDRRPGSWPGAVRAARRALSTAWVALAGTDDFVLTDVLPQRDELADLANLGWPIPRFVTDPGEIPRGDAIECIPWGWSPSIERLAAAHGWHAESPGFDVVRHVNSRALRLEIEQSLGIGLEHAARVDSLDALEHAIARMGHEPRGWILKSNQGMAGRESFRGRGAVCDGQARHWARRRLDSTGSIVCEPLLESLGEAGIQVEIPRTGKPCLLGVVPLMTSGSGTYRGSRIETAAEEIACWSDAARVALEVADRLRRLGYFGPLGIDAMRYRDREGRIRMRPLQDLNARFTMGLLALGFQPLVPPGGCATWLQGIDARGLTNAFRNGMSDVKVIRTSHRSALILAATPEHRAVAEAMARQPPADLSR